MYVHCHKAGQAGPRADRTPAAARVPKFLSDQSRDSDFTSSSPSAHLTSHIKNVTPDSQMPLRPSPIPFSIGTDIVHVSRVRAILTRAQGQPDRLNRFLRRFLTPFEQNAFVTQYKAGGRWNANELLIASRHLAGRWAAKEAAIKAVTWRQLRFHDIMILPSSTRRGLAAIILDSSGSAAGSTEIMTKRISDADHEKSGILPQLDIHSLQGQVSRISISHDGEYATAVCLAAEEPVDGDVGGEAAARERF